MSEYLRYSTFRRRQPDAISSIFEKLMKGFLEVKGGVITKVITVHKEVRTEVQDNDEDERTIRRTNNKKLF
jgi:choline-glycine betaine transporter